jgi:hypothetical protein
MKSAGFSFTFDESPFKFEYDVKSKVRSAAAACRAARMADGVRSPVRPSLHGARGMLLATLPEEEGEEVQRSPLCFECSLVPGSSSPAARLAPRSTHHAVDRCLDAAAGRRPSAGPPLAPAAPRPQALNLEFEHKLRFGKIKVKQHIPDHKFYLVPSPTLEVRRSPHARPGWCSRASCPAAPWRAQPPLPNPSPPDLLPAARPPARPPARSCR